MFAVNVGFVSWYAVFDLALEEPEWPTQEFFNVFLCYGRCVGSDSISALTDFEKM